MLPKALRRLMKPFSYRSRPAPAGWRLRFTTHKRPWLEALEDRTLPTVDVFTNPLGGTWELGSNWSLNAPPTSDQDATVAPVPFPEMSVTFGA
jgi:hypothetical protein